MTAADLEQVAALALSDNASWTAQDYLAHHTLVAVSTDSAVANAVEGFAAARTLVPDEEHEILNIVVDPRRRGQGIGSKLLKTLLASSRGLWFLEVRRGNAGAIGLYKSLGFNNLGVRSGYYQNPDEDAIVMRIRS